MKLHRNGPVGALMDEYERAVGELAGVVESLSDEEYGRIRDAKAEEDFRSVRDVLAHVVGAGFGHAGLLRHTWGLERVKRQFERFPRGEARARLQAMFDYACATFEGKWDWSEDQMSAVQVRSGWGVVYDVEQLLEHTLVHVLRHRRQIERFLAR